MKVWFSMRSKFLKIILTIIASVIVFCSCKETPKQILYIPQGTASVIVVNQTSIAENVDFRKSVPAKRILNYFAQYGFSNETFDLAIEAFYAPNEKTGIQNLSDVAAYMIPSQEFRNVYNCMSVMLDDSASFDAYLQTTMSANYQVLETVENCRCYINRNDRFSWIAFNDEVAVFGCSTIHTKGIAECVNAIFSPKPNSLAKNSDFADFWENKSDVSMWMATSDLIDTYLVWHKQLPQFFMLRDVPEKVLRDNYIHLNTKFDKNVTVSLACHPSGAFKRFWKKNNFTTKSFDKDFCKILPKNTLWFMTLSVDPMRFLSQIKETEGGKYIEKELAKLDITLEDFLKSFEGDAVFSMYDITLEQIRSWEFSPQKNTQEGKFLWNHLSKEQKTTFPHIACAMKMNNSRIANMVLTHVSSDVCEQITPGLYNFSKIMGFPSYIVCRDDFLALSTDKEYAQSLIDNSQYHPLMQGETVLDLVTKADGCASYHYVDFSIDNYPKMAKQYLEQMDVLPLVTSYSSIVKSAEMTLTDSYEGNIVVDFQDTSKNSLLQLNDLFEIILP